MSRSEQRLYAQALESLQNGDLVGAQRHFEKFLRLQPTHIGALNLIGIVLISLKRDQEAEKFIRKAISLNSGSDVTFYNYGIALKNLGKLEAAYDAFSKALAINPNAYESWSNRGTILNELARHEEAIADFDRALALKSDYAEALGNKGNTLGVMRRPAEALAAIDAALRINPGLPEIWASRGRILGQLKQYEEAAAAYDAAIRIKPELAMAWVGRGLLLNEQMRFGEAASAFATALKLDPTVNHVRGILLHARAQACDWDGLAEEWAHLIKDGQRGAYVSAPLAVMATRSSPADQQMLVANFAAETFSRLPAGPFWRGERYAHDRIRIGYLSEDFNEHAVSFLATGLFEHHDRTQFETFAFSYGIDDGSEMRRRQLAAFEHFIDVRSDSDRAIAERIRGHEIDIMVDLAGYTGAMRPGILAMRPAPVQVNYLGYPGTMGVDFIDYVLADRFVVPSGDDRFYAEKVVRLPHSYLPNDSTRRISETTPARAEAGLPADGFVFCSFNNSFKITPDIFDVWMGLLRDVEGSVLWLRRPNSACVTNLKREAQKRGVAPERLVFAPLVARHDDYLARHRLADLFLDTLYYNAHTTACDALWAGVPVLTCIGTTFAGRVGASLLNSVGLPEMIATSLDEYRDLALSLARDPQRLAALKQKLAERRDSCPLFDTEGFTRHIESVYRQMWQRHQRGEAPQAFTIEALQER